MNSFELNKIFAAILVAGIAAYMGWFVAEQLVHPHELHEDAVAIDGGEVAAGGASKPAGPEPVLQLIAEADVAKGQKMSKACASCHSFEKGGPDKVGPNLWGVVGGAKAGKDGFAYSSALEGLGGSWSYADLNKFLWKPKQYAPGTKMNYLGLKKPEQRAQMIAWLRTLSDSPSALPSDAQIAAEAAELAPPEEESSEDDAEVSDDMEGEAAPEAEEKAENPAH